MEQRSKSWCGEVNGERSTNYGCPEPDAALCSARRVESSSHLDSLRAVVACKVQTSEKVPTVVAEMTSSTMWQRDLTAKSRKYARSDFSKLMVAPWKRVKFEAEGCLIAEFLKPLSKQAMGEKRESCMADAYGSGLCQGSKKPGPDGFATDE